MPSRAEAAPFSHFWMGPDTAFWMGPDTASPPLSLAPDVRAPDPPALAPDFLGTATACSTFLRKQRVCK